MFHRFLPALLHAHHNYSIMALRHQFEAQALTHTQDGTIPRHAPQDDNNPVTGISAGKQMTTCDSVHFKTIFVFTLLQLGTLLQRGSTG